jgi:hypothetical protein
VCPPAENTRFHRSASKRRTEGGKEESKNTHAPRAQGSSSQVLLPEAISRGLMSKILRGQPFLPLV